MLIKRTLQDLILLIVWGYLMFILFKCSTVLIQTDENNWKT